MKSTLSRWVPGFSRAQTAKNRANAHANKARGLSRLSMVLWAVLVLLLLVAIWWFGPGWEIGGVMPLAPFVNRVAATLVIVALVAVVWGVRLARRLRELDSERAQEAALQQDPILAQVERQEASLNAVLGEITESLGGGNARYRLPWYLVMGVENAGKTSLINRSGQNFALTHVMKASGQSSKQGQLGFDWWIGDQAVLIDPDGELLTQGAMEGGEPQELQRRLWDHFVDWLERNRAQRPLDGIVLVLDLARLSHAQVAVRKAYAALLRSRLRELMERHGARLPVYVTFSKMDLLHGFDDFFRHYSRAARKAPLGFTFTPGSMETPGQWEREFAADFDAMLTRLNQLLPTMLAECRDREERESVFRFVRQLAGLRDVLLGFLTESLSSDRFSTAAMVRGTYFTSVYQQGVPEDPFVDAAARRYGMDDSVQPAHRATRSALYFTEELFDKVIYPEAGLAADNARVTRRQERARNASLAICAVLGVALVGGWTHFYQKNSVSLSAVEERAETFLATQPDAFQSDDPSGRELLEPLDRLRYAMQTFGEYRTHTPYFADMGLYQGHVIGAQVERAYLAMLENQFLPALMIGIMDDMNRAEEGSNEKLALLRVLRMMSDQSGRQTERVERYMAHRWQGYFPQQADVQQRLMGHLDYAMTHSDLQGRIEAGSPRAEQAMAPLAGSIEAAQRDLLRQPIDERVYAALKAAGNRRGEPLDLRRSVGTLFNTVFMARNDDPEHVRLPYLVTRDGFENYFLQELDRAVELALIDVWVLGQRNDIDFSEADKEQLQVALREHYVSDYQVSWRDALRDIRLVPLPDIHQAIVVADALVGAQRPLDRLLDAVARNTSLYPELPEDDDQAREALRQSQRYQLALAIEQPFTPINRLGQADNDNPSSLTEIKVAITQLRDYLREIEESSDSGRSAFVSVRDRLSLRGSDPLENLKRIADDTPEPVGRMLHQLADQSWELMMASATRHLESLWLDEVVAPYQERLAGRYPLAPGASREVALSDFEDFFAPGGILDTFYEDSLKPFIEGAPEYLTDAEGNSLLRESLYTAVDQAEQIRRAYFSRDGALDVEFALEPVSLSANKRRSVISVDGQLIEYAHSASQRVSMIWPNSLRGGTESRITLVPSEVNRSPRSVAQDGAWAWFRLLEQADITSVSERELELRFNVDGGTMRYRLYAGGAPNPFTRPLAAGFQLPSALYAERGGHADAI
ncbi:MULTISPECIES: type VI secretion system membrane subunit TssM [unclassified Halomonas]|uniref:type VI secretion system membrane subunit TssM n=1 Tax=unclassified Halomonas TaxID=2609666 RepID=UPI0020A0E6CD|nr:MULTISPECIES: type VI secretion system membrane subunit TssM [unclassified Halomonas]MCP1315643.1 type VI secretion system membrane subunit TssM [Halomonas sp. 707D7]MCP1327418.1 type VI secretion system membrane subunit TssM [Halomonas sp. 707D4]